jgi:hypothetical protein
MMRNTLPTLMMALSVIALLALLPGCTHQSTAPPPAPNHTATGPIRPTPPLSPAKIGLIRARQQLGRQRAAMMKKVMAQRH